jgi:hypothetical protein
MIAKGSGVDALIFVIIFAVSIALLERGRRGKEIRLNRPPALDALDDLVGRCTEMGRPLHWTSGFVGLEYTGWGLITLASIGIANYVAKLSARLGAHFISTVCMPSTYAVVEEGVKEAYISEGKGDVTPDVRYISPEQMAYAAGVMRTVATEKPAGNIAVGGIGEECLMLIEPPAEIGAVQVCGTVAYPSNAFMLAICEYNLIAEECYVAGAILSGDKTLMGAIGAQDITKFWVIALIVVGAILATLGIGDWLVNLLNM